MSSPLTQLPRRVRSRLRREVDERASRRANAQVREGLDVTFPDGSVLVLVADPDARRGLPPVLRERRGAGPDDITVLDLFDASALPLDAPREADTVVLLASDRSDLRRAVASVPELGHSARVMLWFTALRSPVTVQPRPDWPPLAAIDARRFSEDGPGVVTELTFARRVRARGVLAEVAVQSAPSRERAFSGLFTGYLGEAAEPGLDAGARQFAHLSDLSEHDLTVPLDVLVVPAGSASAAPEPHHVTARAPWVVEAPSVAPVDEAIFNPVRWSKRAEKPSLTLSELTARSGHVTEGVVRRARAHRSVRVDLATAEVQDVLRLAMAGVPLEVSGIDAARTGGLDPRLLDVFAQASPQAGRPIDLSDRLEREEYSLRQRRATFDAHSTLAHRAARAAAAGLGRLRSETAGLPPISILLATRREHELATALASVRKQVGVEIELVVATHGFTTDEAKARELLGEVHGLTVLGFGAETRFGDVLTAAAQAAAHDVVMKMDDDDWYSPHAVHDLLMARRYSGADLVGMPTEFVHLVEFDQTVRRIEPAETFTSHVAGGTMTLSRDLLREVGWFRPVLRWVDAQLLASVAAVGGTTYRTHGLGYVLVRHAEGHTWSQDPEAFRNPRELVRLYDGFRPPGLEPGEQPGEQPGDAPRTDEGDSA